MAHSHEIRLIDTNIVSMSYRDDTRFINYQRHLFGFDLAVSFMTVAELYAGATTAGWGAKRWARLELHLENYSVIPSDDDICRWYGIVHAHRLSIPISTNDALIAATALSHGVKLVTHNPRDFRDIPGLKVISEVS